ncbi:MAG: type VII secretion target [Mycobacterium sp.]
MTNPLVFEEQVLRNLSALQDYAADRIGNSLLSNKFKAEDELGGSVRTTHGAVCTASFAAVRNALSERVTAVTNAQAESERLSEALLSGITMYRGTDSGAAGTLNKEMPSA